MYNINDNLFTWITGGMSKSKHNFCLSGMPELDLNSIGVKVDYDEYKKRRENIEREFNDLIAQMFDVEPDQVLSTTGGTEGIALGSIFLHKNSDCIDVPVPEYEPMYRVPESIVVAYFHTPASGVYNWQCEVDCGTGASGWGGAR